MVEDAGLVSQVSRLSAERRVLYGAREPVDSLGVGASPGVHSLQGPTIELVARTAYVAEPTDAPMIRQPVSRAAGGARARPARSALTCSVSGSAANRQAGIGHASPHGLAQEVRPVSRGEAG